MQVERRRGGRGGIVIVSGQGGLGGGGISSCWVLLFRLLEVVLFEGVTVLFDGAMLLFAAVVLFDGGTVLFCGVMVLFGGITVFCSIADTEGVVGGTKLEGRSALFKGKKEVLLSKEEKGGGEGVLLEGGAGPETSQEGGEEADLVPKIMLGWKGDEFASKCSVKVTWNELKRRSDVGSQSW